MRDDIAFDNKWNLQGYRRSTEAPDIYVVVTEGGTLVDTHGYLPGMLNRVSMPFQFDFDQSVPVLVGSWRKLESLRP